ncbi:hypothetical protein L6164_021536 [Bauhinia variegata]|uniref:Uncharacterized protein n=1 Tax=Bauhinia variegata TaxID=167791 RepID=A0ACB9MYT0_BAUVA|nr:hypothetical protein L6164_021536 [Bauhinia variegata]
MSLLSPEASPGTNSTTAPPPPVPAANDTSPPPPVTTNTSNSPNNSNTPSSSPQPSNGGLVGLIVGTVFGGLLMLLIVGICAFFCKRKKLRRKKRYGLEDYPGGAPQGPKADQFGGGPQNWQPYIRPPSDDIGTLPPKPTPSLGVGPKQKFSPTNAPSPPVDSSTSNSLGSERPRHSPSPSIALGLSQSIFTYDELAMATNGFSNSNLVGQGGFGNVYKGVLGNGKTVAVKQLKSGSLQGEREFQAEVEIISRVHHRHLVSLVGYCMAGTQRMLVYEFLPNNTLEFHLHGKDRPTMDWSTRMKIAIGSAKGLAYLHEDCQPKIIHRDIKASNILLDDNFESKVADFGLAKFSPDANTHVSTRVMGTFGYLAPEYASSGKLTDKSDVFSFGVVLLELITGRKPVDRDESFPDDSMVEWARPLLSQALENGSLEPLADPRLQKNYNSDEMIRMVACAATCVRNSARRRPQMSQVVRALEGNISLDDLNEGIAAGHSRAFGSFESSSYDTAQYKIDIENCRKLALGGQEEGTSEYGGPSSEYGQHTSSSSSDVQQNSQVTDMESVNLALQEKG